VIVDEVHINGELTKGEDVADLGGEILAYMSWGTPPPAKNLQPADGLTPEQRFFIGFCAVGCANETPGRSEGCARRPTRIRRRNTARQRSGGEHAGIAKAFSCRAGQPMVKPAEKICKVW